MKTYIIFASYLLLAATLAAADAPNVVVILSDDYGWGSLGSYGAPKELYTPYLDRLAHEGRRFTNAYAPGSVCSPTRYGLMTGRYYWRTSIKDGEVLPNAAPLHIEESRLTLASLLKSKGYRTAAFGKWHLGMGTQARRTDWSQPLGPGPRAVGFDYFFGLASNPWSGPHSFIENEEVPGKIPGQPVAVNGNREGAKTEGIREQWKEDHIMKTLTEHVVGWLAEQKPGQPFFLYFAPNAVHRPVAPNPAFAGTLTAAAGGSSPRDHVILQAADATYAIRASQWKLVERVGAPPFEHRNRNAEAKAKKRPAFKTDELYDLAADPAETTNVIDKHPQQAKRLKEMLISARDRGFTRNLSSN